MDIELGNIFQKVISVIQGQKTNSLLTSGLLMLMGGILICSVLRTIFSNFVFE